MNKRTMDSADQAVELSSNESIFLTREDALAYLELDASVRDYDLDQQYWKLIKKYRTKPKENSEELKKINAAYAVATGAYQDKVQKEVIQQNSRKIFGRTLAQWRVHFYYSWWKYILGAVLAVFMAYLIHHYFIAPKMDLHIVAIGHFEKHNDRIEDYAKKEMGFKNPAVFSANLIVDNAEPDDEITMYGNLAAAAFLSVSNDVILTDARTFPFYLLYYEPIDDVYFSLMNEYSEEERAGIEPLYYSRAEHHDLLLEQEFSEEIEVITDEDRQSHVFGLMITDPDLIYAMGFDNRWLSEPPTLVFCVSANSKDKEKSKQVIKDILTNRADLLVQTTNE